MPPARALIKEQIKSGGRKIAKKNILSKATEEALGKKGNNKGQQNGRVKKGGWEREASLTSCTSVGDAS